MANFTIAKLTTAVSDNFEMDGVDRVGLTTDSNFTTYNGTMTVRNWLTGGVIALGRALKNYGNPFFDECNESENWTDGTTLNDTIFPKRL